MVTEEPKFAGLGDHVGRLGHVFGVKVSCPPQQRMLFGHDGFDDCSGAPRRP